MGKMAFGRVEIACGKAQHPETDQRVSGLRFHLLKLREKLESLVAHEVIHPDNAEFIEKNPHISFQRKQAPHLCGRVGKRGERHLLRSLKKRQPPQAWPIDWVT
jgi:hypothetical protein